MYRLLDMEESDLCSKRGLLPNTDQQTFEMYLPSIIHELLKEYRRRLLETAAISHNNNNNKRPINTFGNLNLGELDKAKMVSTYVQINNFLINFIAHMLDKADYRVQDNTSMESMLDFESSSVSQGIGYFYNGKKNDYY